MLVIEMNDRCVICRQELQNSYETKNGMRICPNCIPLREVFEDGFGLGMVCGQDDASKGRMLSRQCPHCRGFIFGYALAVNFDMLRHHQQGVDKKSFLDGVEVVQDKHKDDGEDNGGAEKSTEPQQK
jgi:hypothetical protein